MHPPPSVCATAVRTRRLVPAPPRFHPVKVDEAVTLGYEGLGAVALNVLGFRVERNYGLSVQVLVFEGLGFEVLDLSV